MTSRATSPIAAIAFDLDGTLVDSAGGIAHALNSALAQAGLQHFDLKTVRRWIGDGPDALIARALAANPPDTGDVPALAARLRRGFDAATLAAPMTGSAVFAGVAHVVEALALRHPLVVVTNKPTPLARAVLDHAGLLAFFGAVHGADTAPQRKPAPLLIEQAAARLGIAAGAMLMVGDAEVDIAAARAAGSAIAWAGWGYGRAPPRSRAPIWRLSAPQELLARFAAPHGH
ncbi:MAG TPA: HAD-IA family hydrolase [Burkholderiaceae bacterium]|jgi:phosphoglycolate phosphatase